MKRCRLPCDRATFRHPNTPRSETKQFSKWFTVTLNDCSLSARISMSTVGQYLTVTGNKMCSFLQQTRLTSMHV